MSNIFKETIGRVCDGASFKVNFETKSLKVNGKYLIKNKEYEKNLGCQPSPDPLKEIERLYDRFRHSVPSERSENKKQGYFRALPENMLSNDDMLFGVRRETAQAELEVFILCQMLQGTLKWDDFASGLWFWQSPIYPSLILLKKWFN